MPATDNYLALNFSTLPEPAYESRFYEIKKGVIGDTVWWLSWISVFYERVKEPVVKGTGR